ncbi:MAG TPA: hypothetical protein VGN52_09360 [Burkholderiales bacterium]|jgi:hypothetical protein
MWVIALEICFAIGMAVFIIWWTWPRKPKPPAQPKKTDKRADS